MPANAILSFLAFNSTTSFSTLSLSFLLVREIENAQITTGMEWEKTHQNKQLSSLSFKLQRFLNYVPPAEELVLVPRPSGTGRSPSASWSGFTPTHVRCPARISPLKGPRAVEFLGAKSPSLATGHVFRCHGWHSLGKRILITLYLFLLNWPKKKRRKSIGTYISFKPKLVRIFIQMRFLKYLVIEVGEFAITNFIYEYKS